jgi:hypothetical protein
LAELFVSKHQEQLGNIKSEIKSRFVSVKHREDQFNSMALKLCGLRKDKSKGNEKGIQIANFMKNLRAARADAPFIEKGRLGMQLKDNNQGMELIHGINERTRNVS